MNTNDGPVYANSWDPRDGDALGTCLYLAFIVDNPVHKRYCQEQGEQMFSIGLVAFSIVTSAVSLCPTAI